MLSSLKNDYILLRDLHVQRVSAPIDGAGFGVRALYIIYIHILEDCLQTLRSLIEFLEKTHD